MSPVPPRVPFALKLLKRLDRVDHASVQTYLLDLAGENAIYEEVLHELNEGVLILTEDGRIRFANRPATRWLGLEAIPEDRWHIRHAGFDAPLSRWLLKNLPGLSVKVVEDLEILGPREMRFRVTMSPLENSSRKEVLVLLTDLAVGKNSERPQEKLDAIETLIKLAAGIAHEIGNPLNSIAIHLALLKKELKAVAGPKRKTLENTLEVLNSETGRLDKIIRNFLKATRKPPLRFRSEDLNGVVEESLTLMRPELEKNRVRIHFEPDRALPAFMMDRERLLQAFINLIKNAREAMKGGGNLTVRVSHKNHVAFLSFKDDGAGISEQDLPHIFEIYYTTKAEGSGLGLATVFHAVREHGGRIEVTSKPGRGSTFTLLLPIRQPKLQLPEYRSKK